MSGSELLNGMLSAAYGQTVPANHYMTITDAITDPDSDDYSVVTNKLSEDLRIILGLNDTFSNLVIQDDLSKYVDLYGLTAGSSASAIMNAAKAKVTMTVPDPEHPEDPPLYQGLSEERQLPGDPFPSGRPHVRNGERQRGRPSAPYVQKPPEPGGGHGPLRRDRGHCDGGGCFRRDRIRASRGRRGRTAQQEDRRVGLRTFFVHSQGGGKLYLP